MILQTSLLLLMHIAVLIAAPTSKHDAAARILKFENTNDGFGNYHFSYETSNGISRDETGTLQNAGQPNAHIKVEGTVSYLDTNGELISVRYSADENGYHVLHMDVSQPVPVFVHPQSGKLPPPSAPVTAVSQTTRRPIYRTTEKSTFEGSPLLYASLLGNG